MTLVQRIQELRKQRGLSQEGLGEALGVSRQAVSKWEGDNGIPELDTLIAMSRLFGITIGELLGVEEAASAPAQPDNTAEEKLEAILQKYSEAQQREPQRKIRWDWIAVAAMTVVGVIIVLSFQLHSMGLTVQHLESQVRSLEVQVSNKLNNLSGQIRNSIYDILAEQEQLVSSFDWEVLEADLENQTAVVRFYVTLKEYPPNSRIQLLLDWVTVAENSGKTESAWVEGPDFAVEVTIPMNYHSEVSLRVQDAEGGIREQYWGALYELHPENFQLQVYNVMMPFAITAKATNITSVTVKSESPHVDIYTLYPQLFRPEKAVLTATVNGKTVFSEEMQLPETADEQGDYAATIRDGYFDMTLAVGDKLEVRLEVTDNLGRTQTFVEGGTVVHERGNGPRLEHTPMAAPVVGLD